MIHEKIIGDKDGKKGESLGSTDVVNAELKDPESEDLEKIKENEDREKAKLLRMQQREKEKEKAKSKGKKRSMDVDVVTRFTSSSSKPKKARSEEEESIDVSRDQGDEEGSTGDPYIHQPYISPVLYPELT